MTRKDYVKLAEAISEGANDSLWLMHNISYPGEEDRERRYRAVEETRLRIVEKVSAVLKADNGNFDKERFAEASLPTRNWSPELRTEEV